MRNMQARAAAKAAGEQYYDSGQPCKQGHLALRATKSGSCVLCTRAAAQAWTEARPGKAAEYAARYRKKDPAKVRAQDAASLAQRRALAPDKYRAAKMQHYRKTVAVSEGRSVRPKNRTTIAELTSRLQEVHKGALVLVSGFRSVQAHALFRCVQHQQDFRAIQHNVLRGAQPCTRCNHTKSKAEDALVRLMQKFTPVVQRDRVLIKPRELDLYLPEKKMAIEYCGMYWHSHFNAEDERADKLRHMQKHLACQAHGVRLLTIFESEWQERGPAIRRLLRNAAGKSRGKLMARKCELRKVETPEARAFFEKYHPQGGAGSGEHYGLYWGAKLVACMRFAFGANDRGAVKTRVWTLGRFATRVAVVGAASRLFQAFVEEQRPGEVKSFSDNRYFAGGVYAQMGFVLEAEAAPDYQVWSPILGLRPKTHYQRRLLPARMREHGMTETFSKDDPRTEAEMTYAMGCGRIYDCGKKRWLWRAPT